MNSSQFFGLHSDSHFILLSCIAMSVDHRVKCNNQMFDLCCLSLSLILDFFVRTSFQINLFSCCSTQLSFIKEHEGSLQMENERLRDKLSRQDTSGDRDDDIR